MLGSGTEGDPYIIQDVTDLQAVEDDRAAYYELEGNIDASATSGWNGGEGFVPITDFTGNFDGKDYKITSLFINRTSTKQGLFGTVDTSLSVKNVTLASADVTGAGQVGALIGWLATGSVSECHTGGSVGNSARVTGGLIGKMAGGDVTDCSSSCAVTSVGANGKQTGGLIGEIEFTNGGSVVDCSATGAVVGGDNDTGGFVGNIATAAKVTIQRCFATGSVICGDSFGGGFAGNYLGTSQISTVEQCFATGNVTVTADYGGGFVGYFGGGATKSILRNCYARGDVIANDFAGGFAGSTSGDVDNQLTDNCYSTGTTAGTTQGGFCGDRPAPDNDIVDCFWDTETSGDATSDGGTGKTTSQMKAEATFTDAGWDFSTVWDLRAAQNNGYPVLDFQPGLGRSYARILD